MPRPPHPTHRAVTAKSLHQCSNPVTAGGDQAFECREELEACKTAYNVNRDYLLNELPNAGFGKILPADGAFYLYADISDLTDDSRAFTRAILEETGVALTPGMDFDARRGQYFLRFSYARSRTKI